MKQVDKNDLTSVPGGYSVPTTIGPTVIDPCFPPFPAPGPEPIVPVPETFNTKL